MLALVVALSLAGSYEQCVADARLAMEQLKFEEAAVHWETAVELASDADARAEAHLGAGIARRVMGDDTVARLHFINVLRHEPWRRLTDDEPPRVRLFFEMVREELEATEPRVAAIKLPPEPEPEPVPKPASAAVEPPAVKAPEVPAPLMSPAAWTGTAILIGGVVVGATATALAFANIAPEAMCGLACASCASAGLGGGLLLFDDGPKPQAPEVAAPPPAARAEPVPEPAFDY